MPLKLVISKKVVPDFRYSENIHGDREIFPPPHTHTLKLRHFCTDNISKNRHMKYYTCSSLPLRRCLKQDRQSLFLMPVFLKHAVDVIADKLAMKTVKTRSSGIVHAAIITQLPLQIYCIIS